MIIDTVKFSIYPQKLGEINNRNPKQFLLSPAVGMRLTKDVFEPSFKASIPCNELLVVGKNYLKKVSAAKTEESVYSLAKDYYYENVLPIISDMKNHNESKGALTRLFRHELINSTSSPLELNMNPEYKILYADLTEGPGAKYLEHQKGSFHRIVSTINDMAVHWKTLESWQKDKHVSVKFSRIISEIEQAINISNHDNVPFLIRNDIRGSKTSVHAFDLYNLLSQVALNGIKYSAGKPVSITFSQVNNPAGEPKYLMTVLNVGTKPIPDSEIDRILEGTGYRSKLTDIDGTGTGYKEIIHILQKYNRDQDVPALIEKGRTEGVKVTVPFNLL